MAYTKNIKANTDDSHQATPGYVITFIRWATRDVRGKKLPASKYLEVLETLIVTSDCINLTVTDSKSSPTGSFNGTFICSDVNYMTAVAPGDLVFINMHNDMGILNKVKNAAKKSSVVLSDLSSSQDAAMSSSSSSNDDDLADASKSGNSINFANSGFKGMFRVQNVSQNLQVQPSGIRSMSVSIQGTSYSEYQNKIFFQKHGIGDSTIGSFAIIKLISQKVDDATKKGINSNKIHFFLKLLIEAFMGAGVEKKTSTSDIPNELSGAIFIPPVVGHLMGSPGGSTITSIYRHNIGIENYSDNKYLPQELGTGIDEFSFFEAKERNTFHESSPISGFGMLNLDIYNDVTIWSVFNRSLNQCINEMFTTTKLNDQGNIVPTLVIRQIPFTTDDFPNNDLFHEKSEIKGLDGIKTTTFSSLPRWDINPNMLLGYSLSRSDTTRVNFLFLDAQTGTSSSNDVGNNAALSWGAGFWDYDENDVKRSGLRTYTTSTLNDTSLESTTIRLSKGWTGLISDWVLGQHLKLNGTINLVGISDAIALGDNVQFDGLLAHIESITHTFSTDTSTGTNSFRTSLGIVNGIKIPPGQKVVQEYGEMKHQGTDAYNDDNYKFNEGRGKSLPTSNHDEGVDSKNEIISKKESLAKSVERTSTLDIINSPGRKKDSDNIA